jgi:hypothetical protein
MLKLQIRIAVLLCFTGIINIPLNYYRDMNQKSLIWPPLLFPYEDANLTCETILIGNSLAPLDGGGQG